MSQRQMKIGNNLSMWLRMDFCYAVGECIEKMRFYAKIN